MDQDLDLEVPELAKDGLNTQVGFLIPNLVALEGD